MISATSKHSVVATHTGGLAFDVAVRGHVAAVDQPERAGGSDAAPTPLEMMSVALAGCVALYLRKYFVAHALDVDDWAVEVKPVWREDPGRIGRFDIIVHLPGEFPDAHRDAVGVVARSCPVHATLEHPPEIGVRLETPVAAA